MNQLKQNKEYYTNLFEHVMLNTDRIILINGGQKERNLVLTPFLKSDNKHNYKVIVKCSKELIRENIIDQVLLALLPNYYRGLDLESKFKIFENVVDDYAEKNNKLYIFVENIETLKHDVQDFLLKTIINLNTNVVHLIIESEPQVDLMSLVETYDLSSRLFYYELENFAETNPVNQVGHLSREASNDEYILEEIGNEKYGRKIYRYAAVFIVTALFVGLSSKIDFSLFTNWQHENLVAVNNPEEQIIFPIRQADTANTVVEITPQVQEITPPITSEIISPAPVVEDKGYSLIENAEINQPIYIFELPKSDAEQWLDSTYSTIGVEFGSNALF